MLVNDGVFGNMCLCRISVALLDGIGVCWRCLVRWTSGAVCVLGGVSCGVCLPVGSMFAVMTAVTATIAVLVMM